jgi:hypothetical protein
VSALHLGPVFTAAEASETVFYVGLRWAPSVTAATAAAAAAMEMTLTRAGARSDGSIVCYNAQGALVTPQRRPLVDPDKGAAPLGPVVFIEVPRTAGGRALPEHARRAQTVDATGHPEFCDQQRAPVVPMAQ